MASWLCNQPKSSYHETFAAVQPEPPSPVQEEAASRLEEEVDRISCQDSLSAEDVYSIYSLSAVLEYPLMASTEASMGQLLRCCRQIRTQESDKILMAYLDVLETIAGAYFGQDMEMRKRYRDHGVHI